MEFHFIFWDAFVASFTSVSRSFLLQLILECTDTSMLENERNEHFCFAKWLMVFVGHLNCFL